MELFCGKSRWTVTEHSFDEIQRLCLETGVSRTAAKLLLKLGITESSEAYEFLNKGNFERLYDPFLLNDMDKAVARIRAAIDRSESICIYGDYDVDGITSTAVVYNYLSSKNGNVSYYIPKRLTEGYGMNRAAVDTLYERGVKLIVTVDNGITANDEIEYAKSLGIDVVVTDHHECRDVLPDCCAVVNPKRLDSTYPFDGLAGVGVAFKLICALEFSEIEEKYREYVSENRTEVNEDAPFMSEEEFTACFARYIDLTALGTIADVMPLCDENREIVSRGLKSFCDGSSLGITALIAEASGAKKRGFDKNVTTSTVAFLVAPRLNAAGRIGNVERAVEILISKDFEKCLDIADELCRMNRERQNIENEILSKAVEIIEKEGLCDNHKVIVLSGENWHHGVVGIVASRITERYGLPSILICRENGVGKGSARSVKGFNINEAIHECRDLLIRHGGHELAAGLTLEIENIPEFTKRINEIATERFDEEVVEAPVEADVLIEAKEFTLELCEEILRFEPFGAENPTPLFCMKDVSVKEIVSLGQHKHTKLILEKDGRPFEGLLFGLCPDDFDAAEGNKIDLLFNIDINEFRGVRSPQMIIRDLQICDDDERTARGAIFEADKLLSGVNPSAVPTIDKFRAVYKYLRENEKRLSSNFNSYLIARRFCSASQYTDFSVCEFYFILKILEDVNLCEVCEAEGLTMRIKLNKYSGKVDLESSRLLMGAKGLL